jgi:3-oxoacyl-(acyl-carrier-protein) synthase
MHIVGYGCYTAAGKGAHALYQGLLEGRDFCSPLDDSAWPAKPMTGARLCFWPEIPPGKSQCEILVQALLASLDECGKKNSDAAAILKSDNLGVIYASTKGCIEDFVWQPQFKTRQDDTLAPVLDLFIKESGLQPKVKICVSNACSSLHGSVFLGKKWLASGRVRHVLILAADSIGPFVVNGFSALKTFAETRVTPFAKDRQGIQLGDAAGAILLSADSIGSAMVKAIDIESDGFAATRSDQEGVSLRKVVETVTSLCERPDLVIAHATGTPANDSVEDRVYGSLFGKDIPITCIKWSIGHGLGASGAMDLIAALEVLENQKVFAIENTSKVEGAFKAKYLVKGSSQDQGKIDRIMTTTMGFGGMHGAMIIEREAHS